MKTCLAIILLNACLFAFCKVANLMFAFIVLHYSGAVLDAIPPALFAETFCTIEFLLVTGMCQIPMLIACWPGFGPDLWKRYVDGCYAWKASPFAPAVFGLYHALGLLTNGPWEEALLLTGCVALLYAGYVLTWVGRGDAEAPAGAGAPAH